MNNNFTAQAAVPDRKIYFDGIRFYLLFIAGAYRIIQNKEDLNKINYFPVADSDTGTNLAGTFNYMIENSAIYPHIGNMADELAEKAMDGARGNSGNIFAQFFMGLAQTIRGHEKIDIVQLSDALRNSVKEVYKSISEPVEGTVITLMKDFANCFPESTESNDNTNNLFPKIMEKVRSSLDKTSEAMKKLRNVNVVDAGAKGFALFIEGMNDLLTKGSGYITHVRSLAKNKTEYFTAPVSSDHEKSQDLPKLRFCTEGKIKIYEKLIETAGFNDSADNIRKVLSKYGDSIVFTHYKDNIKFHVHTNDPHLLFQELIDYGQLLYQKADDMIVQYKDSNERKSDIALITDSVADLPQELLDKYNVHVVPLLVNYDDDQYLDKVTLKTKQLFENINKYTSYPKSAAPSIGTFERVYEQALTHYNSVIALHLASKLSAVYNNSKKAAENVSKKFKKRIDVIDTQHLSGSLGLLVQKAGELIEQGAHHDSVINEVNMSIEKARIFVSIKTFKYMVMGGRVSPMKGKLVSLLNLKPIISMGGGESKIFDKAFSQKSLTKKIIRIFQNDHSAGNIDRYAVVHSANPEYAQEIAAKLHNISGQKPGYISEISSVVALNAGLGAVAIVYC